MNAEDSKLIKVREGAVAWQEIDGEAILLDLENSAYLGLNGAATVLWPEIVNGARRDDLVATLQDHFDISRDRAATDVDQFLASCANRNLLER